MSKATIVYIHQPVGTPQAPIFGIPRVIRSVLEAQKAGIDLVTILVHPNDRDPVRVILKETKKVVVEWSVICDMPVYRSDTWSGVWIDGGVLFRSAAVTAILESCAASSSTVALRHQGVVGPVWWVDSTAPPLSFPVTPDLHNVRYLEQSTESFAASDSLQHSEDFLIRGLVKDADGVVSRNINRKISTAITRRIAHYPVHPNAVTAVVALVGLSSWPIGWLGTYAGFAIAGFAYWFSAVLDGVDGELSRLKYLGSPLGAWLDTLTDDAVGTAYLIGLFGGLATMAPDGIWAELGWFTVVAFWTTVVPRYWLMITKVGSGDHQKISASRTKEANTTFAKLVDLVAKTVFRTDFLPFFGMMTSILGLPQIFAWSFAIGTIPAMIETVVTLRKWV
ncbi:MAG: CDP-alcohol phosphatidyltransferase family protein [Myxococcales bacterium]|nr:CDP-alcohol phosphatidyltransferase family protein [Myxococcales bacterium]